MDGIGDWRSVAVAITTALEKAREDAISAHLVTRLSIKGATPLAWQIRRDADLLRTEADDRASVVGNTWIEKVEIDTTHPGANIESTAGPLVELRQLIATGIIPSSSYEAVITEIAEELRIQLPPECRTILGGDEATFKSALSQLAHDGVEDVLARLHPRVENLDV